MTAIILLVGARAGEGNPIPPTVVIKMLVNELTTTFGNINYESVRSIDILEVNSLKWGNTQLR